MDAINDILSRTSVRTYNTSEKISDETVNTILKAAMAAPSGVNKQPWAFVVITERGTLDALAAALPYAKMLAKCNLAIAVCGDSSRFLPDEDSTLWVQDVSAASENILLAANALGLGAVWTSVYPHDERETSVRNILELPDSITPFNIIPIGIPAATQHPRDKFDAEKIHYNRW